MRKKKKNIRNSKKRATSPAVLLVFFSIGALSVGALGVYHFVLAQTNAEPVPVTVDPNFGVRAQVEEFFTANNAPEMLPIIKCESQFRHFNTDGSVLMNRSGSSATGVAQILSSKHPDQKALRVYNKRHNTALSVEDFDVTTLEGNLAYALLLYEVRGTRDWECAKKFRFND